LLVIFNMSDFEKPKGYKNINSSSSTVKHPDKSIVSNIYENVSFYLDRFSDIVSDFFNQNLVSH
jgi:hypothetical protein